MLFQIWPISITKRGKRSTTVYQLTVNRKGAYLRVGGRADSEQILQRQRQKMKLLFGLPEELCYQGGEDEVLEICKAFEQNKLLFKASTILKII